MGYKTVDIDDLHEYPKSCLYNSNGKEFLIKRKAFCNDVRDGVDVSYWMYVKKKFLFWRYWSSVTQQCSRVSCVSVDDAKAFIDRIYPKLKDVKYYSRD